MLTRRPAPRPYDVIALELTLTVACAVLVGVLLWLAVGTWGDRGATDGPVIGILAIVALAVGLGWFSWLVGSSGWLLVGASGIAALEVAFLLVLGSSAEVDDLSPAALLVSLACAVLGMACGVFLPSPSSRRYRPEPRVRSTAGAGASPPRVSPQVARVAGRYGRSAVAGVAAGAAAAAAGARRTSRSAGPGAATPAEIADDPQPVLQPHAGTPIRTTGATQPAAARPTPDAPAARPAPPPAPTPGTSRGAAATGVPARGSGASATSSTSAPPLPARPAAPKAAGAPADASAPTQVSGPRSTSRGAAMPPDPGAIARSGRASIDAELATPRPSASQPAASGSPGSPGFRLVDRPRPMTRVRPPSSDGPRLSPVDRPPPPRPPRDRPVGRAGEAQQPADPGGVAPTIRSLPSTTDAVPVRPVMPTDGALPSPPPDAADHR